MSKQLNLIEGPFLLTEAGARFLITRRLSLSLIRWRLSEAEKYAEYRRCIRKSLAKERPPVTVLISRRSQRLIISCAFGQKRILHRAEVRKKWNDQRLFLRVFDRTYQYVESTNGFAELIVFGPYIPETISASLGGEQKRLSQVLEDIGFFAEGDPLVFSVKNDVRTGRRAIIIKWRLEFRRHIGRKFEESG